MSIGNVSPLADVQNIWTAVAKGQDVSTLVPTLKAKRAVFIFASPVDQGQVTKLRELVQCMDAVESPPMVWAPHTVTPEIRPHNAMIDTDGQSTVSSLMELGLDGIISGEPQGQTLALILRMWVHKLEIAAETLSDVLQERHRKAHNVEYYKGHTDSLLWDYLRSRIAPVIPPCDRFLTAGEPGHIDGWAFGSARRTTSGTIYRLNRRHDASVGLSGSKEVAFLVDKQTVRNVTQMMALKRMVDALWMVSCEKWQHPNIQRLFQVYHSQTQIIMRMEYAGAGSLHGRLCRLQRRPLSSSKTSQILQQIFRAVAHLHLGPRVCHRDIKPESFDLHETAETVLLKLTGFQLAFVMEDSWCLQSCGTVPFVAPEVLKGERYDGMSADMWGVGITSLEVLCGPRTVDKVLGMFNSEEKASKAYRRPDDTYLANLIEVFQEPNAAARILQANCLPDAAVFRQSLVRELQLVTWPWRRNRFPKGPQPHRRCRRHRFRCRIRMMNSPYSGWMKMRLMSTSPPSRMWNMWMIRSWPLQRWCETSRPKRRAPLEVKALYLMIEPPDSFHSARVHRQCMAMQIPRWWEENHEKSFTRDKGLIDTCLSHCMSLYKPKIHSF